MFDRPKHGRIDRASIFLRAIGKFRIIYAVASPAPQKRGSENMFYAGEQKKLQYTSMEHPTYI